LVYELAADFGSAAEAMPAERNDGWSKKQLLLLEEAVRRDVHFIARHPTTLFQCLWNSCWWYDCPVAAFHYEPPEGDSPPEGLPWARPGAKLHQLLEAWRARRATATPGHHWLRSLRPPAVALGTGLKAILTGHEAGVTAIAFSPDGHWIASAGRQETVRLWDAVSGRQVWTADAHAERVAFSLDSLYVIGRDGEVVRRWDLAGRDAAGPGEPDADTGVCVNAPLDGGRIANLTVARSPDGRYFATAGYIAAGEILLVDKAVGRTGALPRAQRRGALDGLLGGRPDAGVRLVGRYGPAVAGCQQGALRGPGPARQDGDPGSLRGPIRRRGLARG
jgi:hypothetical protein